MSRSGIAAHVQLRHARTVRGAIQIDLRIAQSAAHLVEILNRNAAGVIAHAIAELLQTGERRLAQCRHRLTGLLPVVRVVAGERGGASRAALIHQHDVVIAVDSSECARMARVQVRGGLAGTARQQEQRRRRRAAVEGGHYGDAELNVSSRRARRVFGDAQHGAARGDRAHPERMLEPALVHGQRGRRSRRRAAQAQDARCHSHQLKPHGTSPVLRRSVSIRYPRPSATW